MARFQSREILQVMTDMESEVSRVYDVDGELGDIKRLKHTIEPFLGYNYTPVVGQDNLPLYDSIDLLGRESSLRRLRAARERLLGG